MSNPRKQIAKRSNDEWYRIIMDCHKNGILDVQYCDANAISRSTFCCSIKRLRQKSFAILDKKHDVDIHDPPLPKQNVIKVDIIPDIQPPKEVIPIPEATPYIDNSHMIEINLGDAHISLCSRTDPTLVARSLSL